jgi:hypothetical protein
VVWAKELDAGGVELELGLADDGGRERHGGAADLLGSA